MRISVHLKTTFLKPIRRYSHANAHKLTRWKCAWNADSMIIFRICTECDETIQNSLATTPFPSKPFETEKEKIDKKKKRSTRTCLIIMLIIHFFLLSKRPQRYAIPIVCRCTYAHSSKFYRLHSFKLLTQPYINMWRATLIRDHRRHYAVIISFGHMSIQKNMSTLNGNILTKKKNNTNTQITTIDAMEFQKIGKNWAIC